MNIKAASQYEGANVLWDQGEMTASIRMLQDLENNIDLRGQAVQTGKPELLAKLVNDTVLYLILMHLTKPNRHRVIKSPRRV